MVDRLMMSPELSKAVEDARAAAREAGELLDAPSESPRSPLPVEVRRTLADWLSSGDFDRDVAQVVADDTDLATQ